jgi:hypothetical protein
MLNTRVRHVSDKPDWNLQNLKVLPNKELLEARKIDVGLKVLFSQLTLVFQNLDETLAIWDKQQVDGLRIRKFQPDVIINRFDYRSAGTNRMALTIKPHGVVQSNNPTALEQLKYVKPWQAKRQFLIHRGGFM